MIYIIDKQGKKHSVEFKPGQTLLKVLIDNDLDEGVGICGGCCDCATCHVRAPDLQYLRLNKEEDVTLEAYALTRHDDSRLGCQLELTEDMNNYIFTIVNEN
tara:strand:+ start:449 stop:754 length:306 start_codon:yes stop_codon:yes gene_type:complete